MPKQIDLGIKGWRCLRCGHKWQPRRRTVPRICPHCKSASWDLPKE